MKKYINYIALLLVGMFASCSDNANWTTFLEPGTYVVGTATVHDGESTVSKLNTNIVWTNKGSDELIGIYQFFKADGNFSISIAQSAQSIQSFGQGEAISSGSYRLQEGATGFKVEKDGFYQLVMNTSTMVLDIIPVEWEMIGTAMEANESMGTPTYDAGTHTIGWAVNAFVKNTGTFVFAGTGKDIKYSGGTATTNSTYTGVADSLTATFAPLTPLLADGAKLRNTGSEGKYTVALKYDLVSRTFSARMSNELFLIGDAYKSWSWGDELSLVPVHSSNGNAYWRIVYLKKGGFKFSPVRAWSGDFGIESSNASLIGNYATGSKNIEVTNDEEGYYLVYVDLSRTDFQISVSKPLVTLQGDIANGSWGSQNEKDLFTIQDKEIVSPPFAADGNLRMSIRHPWLPDWWKAEFIVRNGNIEYRGVGDDQKPSVAVTKNQKVILNFINGTGKIE